MHPAKPIMITHLNRKHCPACFVGVPIKVTLKFYAITINQILQGIADSGNIPYLQVFQYKTSLKYSLIPPISSEFELIETKILPLKVEYRVKFILKNQVHIFPIKTKIINVMPYSNQYQFHLNPCQIAIHRGYIWNIFHKHTQFKSLFSCSQYHMLPLGIKLHSLSTRFLLFHNQFHLRKYLHHFRQFDLLD